MGLPGAGRPHLIAHSDSDVAAEALGMCEHHQPVTAEHQYAAKPRG